MSNRVTDLIFPCGLATETRIKSEKEIIVDYPSFSTQWQIILLLCLLLPRHRPRVFKNSTRATHHRQTYRLMAQRVV